MLDLPKLKDRRIEGNMIIIYECMNYKEQSNYMLKTYLFPKTQPVCVASSFDRKTNPQVV